MTTADSNTLTQLLMDLESKDLNVVTLAKSALADYHEEQGDMAGAEGWRVLLAKGPYIEGRRTPCLDDKAPEVYWWAAKQPGKNQEPYRDRNLLPAALIKIIARRADQRREEITQVGYATKAAAYVEAVEAFITWDQLGRPDDPQV